MEIGYLRRVDLEFLGHATLALDHRDGTLLIDPYDSPLFGGAFRYDPITRRPDWVVCTHQHLDHAARHVVPDAELIEEGRAGPFDVRRIRLEHDEYGGHRRGGSVDALRIEVDDLVVVHLSDVGQSPTLELIEALRSPDVLLIPVGGHFTIGGSQAWEWTTRLAPRLTVPIHYRTAACDLPIDGPEVYLAWVDEWKPQSSGRISMKKGEEGHILLEPTMT